MTKFWKKLTGSVMAVLFAMSGLFFFVEQARSAAGVPQILNQQGRLLDSSGNLLGGASPGTDYCFKFSLYDASAAGTKVWPAAAPSTMTIPVINGVFNAAIGSGSDILDYDFQTSDEVYLNIDVATKVGATCAPGDGAETFESLSPRQRVLSAGYAINSKTVGGFTPAQSATGSQIPVLTSGNLVLGGTDPQINVTGTNLLTIQGGGGTGSIRFFSASNSLSSSGNLDVAGTIQSGSSNVTITLATGFIDADAIGLNTGDGTGSTSNGSGLETDTDRLGLLQGCADGQILKWTDASSVWGCAADASGGGGGTLQTTYDSGNTIATTSARDIAITLADSATDSSFTITTATNATGFLSLARADGAGTADPAQLLLIDNLDTDRVQPIGLKIQAAAGGLTTAVDVSDAEIGTALAIGANDITTSGATISAAELNLLDTHDVALVDTNDAVTTAITGTGALNSGSITSGFGSIDIGADTLTAGSATLTAGTSLTLGTASTNTGAIVFRNSSNANTATIQSGASTGSFTLTLPTDDGGVGEFLQSNGSGVLSWAAPAGSGDVTDVGDCTGGACLDGSSDGGTYIRLYDGDSNYTQLSPANTASDITITLPSATGTLVTTSVATLSSLTTVGALNSGSITSGFGSIDIGADSLTAGDATFTTATLTNTGLHLLDTNASHDLIIAPGSNITADRTLTVTTGDSDRTITLTGNPTLADWFDQSVKTTASPTFNALTLSTALPVASGGTGATSLNNLITLTTHTTGNYVASITNGSSITGADGGSEGAALTLDVADDSINGTELADAITLDAATTFGDGTDSLQIGTAGDLTFIDANSGASITGPNGGALAISAGTGQALNLTSNAASTWTLSSAVNALNFDSNTLSIDASNNRIGIGNAAPDSVLHITGSTSGNGATAIAGLKGSLTLTNPNVAGSFQYGDRVEVTVSAGGATNPETAIGSTVRVTDDSTLANTVRGLEIRSGLGSNTAGTNTAILGLGKTFGIQGVATASAAGISVPAGVYAENQGTTTGNALRAYSGSVTSAAELVSFYHETSTFTGDALLMSMANNSGGFSGNFITLKKGGTTYAHIDDTGETFVSLPGTQTTVALCHANNGQSNNDAIVDCSGAPSDLAENFGTTDPSIEAGDVVMTTGEASGFINKDNLFTSKAWVLKTDKAYAPALVGVVSTQPNQLYADDVFSAEENPRPVTLAGRVPVKVSNENGSIATGDLLTSSSIPGVAMKATSAGMVVGQALSSYSGSGVGKVFVFVSPFFYSPGLTPGEDGSLIIQGGTGSVKINGDTDKTASILNQAGTGDLLQLQAGGVDRLLVRNDGTAIVNAMAGDPETLVLAVQNDGRSLFNINARGDIAIMGAIRIDNEQFAGSIKTDNNGEAEIIFDYDLGTGKPVVELTVEGDAPTFAQVGSFSHDQAANYTGFKIRTFTANGSPVGATVHYLVIAKPANYSTKDITINIPDQQASSNSNSVSESNVENSQEENSASQESTPDSGVVDAEQNQTDAVAGESVNQVTEPEDEVAEQGFDTQNVIEPPSLSGANPAE